MHPLGGLLSHDCSRRRLRTRKKTKAATQECWINLIMCLATMSVSSSILVLLGRSVCPSYPFDASCAEGRGANLVSCNAKGGIRVVLMLVFVLAIHVLQAR